MKLGREFEPCYGSYSQRSWQGRRKHAFSLIELLVVVAIMLILTSLYWGGSSKSQGRRQQAACQQNLERIFMAMQLYANDVGGRYPAVTRARNSEEALGLLVPRCTVETSVFVCPGSQDPPIPSGESITNRQISYAYYMGRMAASADVLITDRQVDTRAKASGQNVFSATGRPPGNNHEKGGNFLFCDGHMLTVSVNAPFALDLTNGVVLLNP